MPEYLTPGVYVEETSFRSRSIEGVSTSTAGFVGPTSRGPTDGLPTLITSFADYQRVFGGLEDLTLGAARVANYVAHAVRAFFDNGGSRLYVARVFASKPEDDGCAAIKPFKARFPGQCGNGRVTLTPFLTPAVQSGLERAPIGTLVRQRRSANVRYFELIGTKEPIDLSEAKNRTLTVAVSGGAAVSLTLGVGRPEVTATSAYAAPGSADVVLTVSIGGQRSTITIPKGNPTLAKVVEQINAELVGGYARANESNKLVLGSERADLPIEVNAVLGFGPDNLKAGPCIANAKQATVNEIDALLAWAKLPVQLRAKRNQDGALSIQCDQAFELGGLAMGPLGLPTGGKSTAVDTTTSPYWFKTSDGTWSAAGHSTAITTVPDLEIVTLNVLTEDRDGVARSYADVGLHPQHPRWIGGVLPATAGRPSDAADMMFCYSPPDDTDIKELPGLLLSADGKTAKSFLLKGGSDGNEPQLDQYQAALARLARVEDISIVAAPGASALSSGVSVQAALLAHAEARRAYRIAVLDSAPGDSIDSIRNRRSQIDSKYAALYYPWVVVSNPLSRPGDASTPKEIALPPSGAVCGIYARNDVERGVHKAPANEVLRSVLRLECDISFGEQEVLNPIGINCLRFFPDRGNRIWGARTACSDAEWKYVNIRRYFNYLERSIDVGTQWVVFEPNGEHLWADIRDSIAGFLRNEWRKGALLGADPKDAFFVRCDRSTMDQNDLDNGRLVVLIGVAVVKPAEFVIFRIGQKTADARS